MVQMVPNPKIKFNTCKNSSDSSSEKNDVVLSEKEADKCPEQSHLKLVNENQPHFDKIQKISCV